MVDRLYSLTEAARFLNVNPRLLAHLIDAGEARVCMTPSGRFYMTWNEIARLKDSRKSLSWI